MRKFKQRNLVAHIRKFSLESMFQRTLIHGVMH